MLRRLVLVGVFVLIRPGSIMQIVAATIFCMLYQLVQVRNSRQPAPCLHRDLPRLPRACLALAPRVHHRDCTVLVPPF